MATDSTGLDDLQSSDSESQTDDESDDAVDDSLAVSPSDLSGLAMADDSEAAAIAVAIAAHLRDREAAAAAAAGAAAEEDGESRRTWAFAGRLEAIGEDANRPPENTPENGWTAAGRADRF